MKALAGWAAQALEKSGVLGAVEYLDRREDRVRIVAYHRVDHVDAEPDLDPGLLSATPEEFRKQVEVVARHYHPISLDDLIAAGRGEATLPPRAVLFSFDDGYCDFAEHAWPTLRAAGVPAVLFVPTAYPDVPGPGFWWDRLHAALAHTDRSDVFIEAIGTLPLGDAGERRAVYRAVRTQVKALPHRIAMEWLEGVIENLGGAPPVHRVLGWDALRTLAGEGLTICSHSHEHALVTQLSQKELAEDLALSKSIVERELGAHAGPAVFAYPSGACDDATARAVREAGYELALSGGRRIDQLPFADPHRITRLPMLRYATPLFRAQLRPSVALLGRILIDGQAARAA